jgi:acetyl-CoA decarbonylase/synthase complex subunit gamma
MDKNIGNWKDGEGAEKREPSQSCCGESPPVSSEEAPSCCGAPETTAKSEPVPCCGTPDLSEPPLVQEATHWIDGQVSTPVGVVPRVSTEIRLADRWGGWKVRMGIGRTRYRVAPGLYAVGDPTSESPVFVTANFKMSFDSLRRDLSGRDGWILVLDTRGVNVWCAAGKGTFGTDEIVKQAALANLDRVVSHRRLIVPQLGAPGVSAHEVKRRSGFRVVYGPVRSEDLPAYLDGGMETTPKMRRVSFPFWRRVELAPVDITGPIKYILLIMAGLVLLSGLGSDGYSTARALSVGSRSALLFLAAYVSAAFLTPAFLPWLPGRSFSLKGMWIGLLLALAVVGTLWNRGALFDGTLGLVSWFLLAPAVASFVAMNFTGASTYTSLSGVRREMRTAVPLQAVAAAVGLGLWITGRFV